MLIVVAIIVIYIIITHVVILIFIIIIIMIIFMLLLRTRGSIFSIRYIITNANNAKIFLCIHLSCNIKAVSIIIIIPNTAIILHHLLQKYTQNKTEPDTK